MKALNATAWFLLASVAAWAQSVSTAQIGGTVRDPTGLAVPGAEVRALQTATGAVRVATTDANGGYIIPSLVIGPYRIEVSKQGFTKFVQSGLVLQVNSNPEVNVSLQVGSVSEQVTVEAAATMAETHTTGIGQVMDNQRIVELPLNGRQATQLIYLTGLAAERNQNEAGNGSQLNTARNYPAPVLSIGGGLTNGVTYLLDGGTHNDPYNNLSFPMPFPDALQEFKVESNGLPAQYGQHSSAAINAVTRSGTNAFHGNLFEFFRNGHLNARNAFDQQRENLKRNQFGGTIGGPIQRDRLFFFVGYQGTRERRNPSSSVANIPTADMLAGDFRGIASAACNNGTAVTLPTSAGFTNNQINPSLLNPQAVQVAGLLNAIPTDACGTVKYSVRANTDENVTLGRVDYQASSKHSLFLRYQAAQLFQPTAFNGVTPLSSNNSSADDLMQSAVLGSTYVLGSNMVNSFRATLNRSRVDKQHPEIFSPADLGIPVYSPEQKHISLTVTGAFALGGGNAAGGHYNSLNYQLVDDVSVVRGSHQFGFGANWIHSVLNGLSDFRTTGVFTFSGQALTHNALADFMLGKLSQYQQASYNVSTYYGDYIGLYAQDSWKVRRNLTINYGVRWDPFLAIHNKYGRLSWFDRGLFDSGVKSKIYLNAPAGLVFPGDASAPANNATGNNQLGNLAPRIGLVWDPQGDGKMTVRAAYGIFYDFPHDFYYWGINSGPPFANLTTVQTPPGGFSNPWQGVAGGNPFPATLGPNAAFSPNQNYVNTTLNPKTTYVNQWNLSIQRQLGRDWLVSANYLGSGTVHLWSGTEANPAVFIPGGTNTLANVPQRRVLNLANAAQGGFYGTITQLDDGGTGSYHSLLLSLQRRFKKGLTVQANYNWSHCISDLPNSEPGIQGTNYMIPNVRSSSRSNCVAVDRRQTLNASAVAQSPGWGSAWMKKTSKDWQLSGIVRAQTGTYFDVTTGIDNALTGALNERPNLLVANAYAATPGVNGWFATPTASIFGAPAAGTYGNLGANAFLGPGRFTTDVSLVRSFRVTEKQSLQIRGEAFNIQNRLNASTPVSATNNPNFGKVQSASDPRIVQLALKYSF